MMIRFLTLLAALSFLAACESAPNVFSEGSSTSASATSSSSGQTISTSASFGDDDRVLFAYDSASLNSRARSILTAQARYLNSDRSLRVIIEGHCDERGTREYNLALGERRASAARDFLIAQGVDGARIKTISYGKERPSIIGSTESAWAQNRRAVSVLQ